MAKSEPSEADLGDYTDYLLLSSSDFSKGWKHNIMKLAPASASDATDPHSWTSAKLNRRDMRRVRREEEEAARKAADAVREAEEAAQNGGGDQAAGGDAMMQGVDVKPGMPGYMVKKEKEERDESLVAPGPNGDPSGAVKVAPRPKRGFGAPKKTRRVFMTEESTKLRRVHFEEQHPWMLETTDNKKPPNQTRWIGKMDSGASAVANGGEGGSYVLFVLDTGENSGSEAAFKVIPANRWYRFASRPKYNVLTGDEVEEEYKRLQKSGDMDNWFSHRRVQPGSSAAGASSAIGAGRMARGPDSFMASGTTTSSAGGYAARFAQARAREYDQVPRSKLRTVIGDRAANDADLFDNEEEAAGPSQRRAGKTAIRPRRRKELADDQYEEFEFEESFQDDEEGIGQVGDEAMEAEDNKELEERIKREMRGANGLGEGVEDADEDDGVGKDLTRAGKRVQKILKKRGRKAKPEEEEDDMDDQEDDEDDETKNPYASSEEESDSETERAEASRKQQQANKQAPKPPGHISRNGSVGPSTGPHYPGSQSVSRAPSAGPPGSRAASPQPPSANPLIRRATSPNGKPGSGSRHNSPTPPPSATKRKAEEGNSPSATDYASTSGKRRKPGSPSPAPMPVAAGDDSALIARKDIIAFIRDKSPTTKELLRHFKSAMARDPRNREVILQVTKEVASITDGKLTLKSEAA